MDTMLKILPPIYLVLYFGLVFVWKSYRVWKQTAVNPFKQAKSDSAQDAAGSGLRLAWLLCIVVVVLHTISDQAYAFLAPIFWLENLWVAVSGLVILSASLIWILIAQMHMGNSWRVGIDADNPSNLVQTGVFARSRNPIFLGMLGQLLGMLLVLPNAASLLAFGLGFILLQIQVRLEEEHLLKTYYVAYHEYFQRVPRWL